MPSHREGPSDHTRVKRIPDRGRYDRATIDAILDEGLVCHLGFAHEGRPVVLPVGYGRRGDEILLHGSSASRMFRTLAEGAPVCCTVTLLDGLVLARSAYHHSMNYRSAVVFGRARAIADAAEKEAALAALTERLVPGRIPQIRPPNELELRATLVLALPIDEASAKVRTGPPIDDDEDYALPVWAGVLPLSLVVGAPVPCPKQPDEVPVPDHVARYRRA